MPLPYRHTLAMIGRVIIGITILTMAACTDHKQSSKNHALIEAAQDANIAAIKQALKDGADINTTDSDGNTALIWAATKAEPTTIAFLMDKNADVSHSNHEHETALMHYAAKTDADPTTLQTLLKKAGKHGIDAKNNKGATALMLAAKYGNAATVNTLLQNQAQPNLKDNDGNTALIYAADKPNNASNINSLLQWKADPNTANNSGIAALVMASKTNGQDTTNASALINSPGIKPNQAQLSTALSCAKTIDMGNLLKDAGAQEGAVVPACQAP